jgi:hypothetical protein
LNKKVLALVKQRYCEDKRIKDHSSVNLTFAQVGPNGDPVFYVEDGKAGQVYVYQRTDMSGLTTHRALDIPAEYRLQLESNPNKAFIASWVYRFTGHRLLADDIRYLTLEKSAVVVTLAPDSMRFKNSFRITRL